MVSPLKDDERARFLARQMHGFLSRDLQLGLAPLSTRAASEEMFGAFLGILRASNPLFPQRGALKALKVRCPLTRRFPTTHTGKLTHYEDVHVSLREVIDAGGEMDNDKMWRLILWIFLGNGGHNHIAWHALKSTPVATKYRPGLRQPLEALRWVSAAVCRAGSVMKVIGSDGLDKKFRLSKARFCWLVDWHAEVPALVESFHRGDPAAFYNHLGTIKGLKGDLTRKEILILLGASRHKGIRRVGQAVLPFGQGAKNGAKTFLGIPLTNGRQAEQFYADRLAECCPRLEAVIGRLFPALPAAMRRVGLGDIEPCLCGAFIYSKQVERLRAMLPAGRWDSANLEACWQSVTALPIPAGFLPHGLDGRPELAGGAARPPAPRYSQVRVTKLPGGRLSRRKLLKEWGLLSSWPKSTSKPRPKALK